MSRTLALILGRAGSKGVPGKNLRPVAGQPCFMWTVDHARSARLVDRVVLSTDSVEMREIGVRAGVDVVVRPPEYASDTATVDAAARHALATLEEAGTPAFDHTVILYANVPVRPEGLIDRAVELLQTSGADSVQSYARVGKYHPWWTAVVNEASGEVRPWEGNVLNHGVYRRQDLPPAHIPDGGVLAVTRRALRLEVEGVAPGPHAFFGRERRGIINPEGAVIDIDSEVDLIVADSVLRGLSDELPLNVGRA